MLSLNGRKKLIKQLNEKKDELNEIRSDFTLAIEELETKPVQRVLTKERLSRLFCASDLFLKVMQGMSGTFEEE